MWIGKARPSGSAENPLQSAPESGALFCCHAVMVTSCFGAMDARVHEKDGDTLVEFTCFDCGAGNAVGLDEIQKERLAIRYHDVKIMRKETEVYYLACTSCKRFNSLKL